MDAYHIIWQRLAQAKLLLDDQLDLYPVSDDDALCVTTDTQEVTVYDVEELAEALQDELPATMEDFYNIAHHAMRDVPVVFHQVVHGQHVETVYARDDA